MAKKRTNEIYRCHCCGVELSPDNCREASSEFSQSGLSAYCVECESQMYNRFAQTQGKCHALLSACAAFNTPLKPILLDGVNLDEEPNTWLTYATLLAESGQDRKNGKLLGFTDGVTTLWGLFGNDLSQKDFAERIRREKEKISKQVGTKEQRERWGTEILYKPVDARIPTLTMTREVYEDLDRVFDTRASSFKGQDLTPQQQSVIVRICKKEIIADHLTRYGATKQATEIEKSISSLLADENMRPKDKKPVEELRLDALVLALEEAGLMENGDLLNCDELIEVLRDRFVKSKKYEYSLDVADQMMLDIINSMRYNADLPYIQDLPEEFAPVDEYGEFEPEETEREKENKRFLGITKVNIVKSDKGEN